MGAVGGAPGGDPLLDLLPESGGDDWLVLAVVELHGAAGEVPALDAGAELADVGGVLQDVIHGAVFPDSAGILGVELPGQDHGGGPGGEAGKEHPDDLRLLRDDDELPVLIGIAEGGGVDGEAPGHALFHAAPDLSGQVQAVIFVHPFDDALDETAEGAVDEGLRDADHLHAVPAEEGLIHDGFLLVPGEAGELPDQDHVEGPGLLPGGGDHPLELRALVGLSPADAVLLLENELRGQEKAVLFGVVADDFELAVRGVFQLVVGGDPDVAGGGADGVHGNLLSGKRKGQRVLPECVGYSGERQLCDDLPAYKIPSVLLKIKQTGVLFVYRIG